MLGLRKGLVLPGGLNAGQQISLLIDRETLAYSGVQSFDDLPTPFRCVATDLVTGKQAVFKDGSLSQAMRATMAIPGLFSPSAKVNMSMLTADWWETCRRMWCATWARTL